jgi:hypothetical protein
MSDENQQSVMRCAPGELEIEGKKYRIDFTFDVRFALVPSDFFSIIRNWFRR